MTDGRQPKDVVDLEAKYLNLVLEIHDVLERHLTRRGRLLRGITLEGQHPDTKLLVSWMSLETGETAAIAWGLWPGFLYAGEPMDPMQVAGIVEANVAEP